MSATSFTTRHFLVALALAGVAFFSVPEARAITYGEPDCVDNSTNTGCLHPNTVQLTGFRPRGGRPFVGNGRCSGSLIAEDANRFVILTAGHCGTGWIQDLNAGLDLDLGVSFDAEIIRDVPSVGPVAWTPRQFILGGQPVLSRDFGPHRNAWVQSFDYAVVVFDIPEALRFTADRWGRPRGEWVDLSEISPVTLPEQDYLLDKVNASDPLTVTTVGYGQGELLVGPGDGGNAGGIAPANWEPYGIRSIAEHTSASSFMGRERHLLFTSQNPAQDADGSCYGDSGGPLFYDDQGVEIQIAVTSSGDNPCRATGINVRTDSERIVEFLACVMAPDAEVEDILACGCTEVNEEGVCPVE